MNDFLEISKEELIYSGIRINVKKRKYIYENSEFEKEIVEFGKSAAVLPINDDRIVLIEQFRYPINKWIIEIPAGRVEKGEDPRNAALRELKEETGYTARNIEEVASFFVSPGYSDELMYLYIAEDLKKSEQSLEKGELIRLKELSIKEVKEMLKKREITDGKTLLALYYYLYYYFDKFGI
ncbi:NUDIX hydrolase [Fervidicoccus fontis]|nr:NUDIX hydrolase [Fervidicoccus fontis]